MAELTGSTDSADNQKIVVEVDDEWTLNLVRRIIAHKEHLGKCNIVPVTVNHVLGQILSQFSIMPELNIVYGELFSNKGAAFFSRKAPEGVTDEQYVPAYRDEIDVDRCDRVDLLKDNYCVKIREKYWLEKRNVIILGHNSKSIAVMEGFRAFNEEWKFRDEAQIKANGGSAIVDITVIDDQKNLEKLDYYKEYPFVTNCQAVSIYDEQTICGIIDRFVNAHVGDTSILILSDDMATSDEMDSKALTFLIYVQDYISMRQQKDLQFDPESIDVIVEILNPKNYDIVHSYSIDNIVISNRYISKMITQIGEKEEIFNFYSDILTYDEAGVNAFVSKEMYVKKVNRFFDETPKPCTAKQLIRAVYDATPADNKAIVCGYAQKNGKMVLFSGNQDEIKVALKPTDKLIIFSNH